LALTDGHKKSLYYKESMASGCIPVKGLLERLFWDVQEK